MSSKKYVFELTITPTMDETVNTTLQVSRWLAKFKKELYQLKTMTVELKDISHLKINHMEGDIDLWGDESF